MAAEKYQDFVDQLDKGIDARTFGERIKTAKQHLADPECPPEVKVIIGNWFFRRISMNYKPDESARREIARPLLPAIRKVTSIPMKGLYLNYVDTKAMNLLAKQFWSKRFPEKYFVLQLVNDQQLIKNYLNDSEINDEVLVDHFLRWAQRTDEHTQKSNLLDILLRYYAKDPRVIAYNQKLKYGDSKVKNIYTDAQNVHDEEISDAALKACDALLDWASQNPIPTSEMDAVKGKPSDWIIARLPRKIFGDALGFKTIASGGESPGGYLEAILNRLAIDHSTFGEYAFSMTDVVMATIHYIRSMPAELQEGRWEMLRTEMQTAAELCASGYVTRFIMALQGCDPAFSVTISEAKRIEAIVTTKFGLKLQEAPENVIAGSYNAQHAVAYRDACVRYLNEIIRSIEDVDVGTLNETVCKIAEEATGLKGWVWDPDTKTLSGGTSEESYP